MAITSGFFNSLNGDRRYNAEQIGNYFEGLISNGVFQNVGDGLVVRSQESMTIRVGPGRAFINSHWLKNDAWYMLNIQAANAQLNRIDRVVIRLDLNESERNVSIVVKTGSVAYSPVAPALTRTETVYELCLAQIYINAGTTSIKQANIIDYRPNTNVCGWVSGIVKQVDTSELFLQWQNAYEEYYEQCTTEFDTYFANKRAEFDQWFADLSGELRIDTTIKKYQNTIITTNETTEIFIGIPQFEEGDILFVHVGGVFLIEDEEYMVDDVGENAKIILTNSLNTGNPVTFIVLKSVVGLNVDSVYRQSNYQHRYNSTTPNVITATYTEEE